MLNPFFGCIIIADANSLGREVEEKFARLGCGVFIENGCRKLCRALSGNGRPLHAERAIDIVDLSDRILANIL